MPTVRRLGGVAELRSEHDGFLVDLWGVVHDGAELGPGVREAIVALAESGARVCFLSNSSRLGPLLADGIVQMGIPRDAFVDVVSSGDVTRAALRERDPAVFSRFASEPRVVHFGNPAYVPWLFELGLRFVDDASEADMVIATGTVASDDEMASIRARLAPLAERGAPLVCTNPDRVVPIARRASEASEEHSKGGLTLAPGAVAHAYASLGGPTFLYGKPHAPIYGVALATLGCPRERVVAIGDMIETDIRGARDASIASVLVTTGVHAAALGASPSDAALAAAFETHGAAPDAVLARFG